MRTYDYHGTEVSLEKGTYRNGTVALMLNETDGELYAVATVNLCHPLQSESMAFLDENNHLGMKMGVFAASGFCSYPLYTLF